MPDKGKKDKGRRESKKKAKLTIKEKRRKRKEKKKMNMWAELVIALGLILSSAEIHGCQSNFSR